MANTITLRAYLDELEHLLDARSPTEVISHCRYILQHYPRNVETYRLLGRALLERGERDGVAEHYDEALEMFQRVLSVLPNDYMAHLGVSQIFQEKGELERAIWHLERAYEQMPGNQALQEALRELYAQRSGEEAPARLQLTRGALAHQYIRARQFEQALVELRAALAEEKDTRLDLQVLLAKVLWEAGHVEDAAEQAARILEVLPDCLEANRILARYWLAHERPSDAQVFLERIEAVDPYEARRTLQPEADAPDPNRLPRLDYGVQAQVATSSETPDWVEELGDLGDFAMESGSVFTAEPEAPAAPLDTDALFGASFQTEAPSDMPSADWVAEVEPDGSSSLDAAMWPEPEMPSKETMPQPQTADMPDWRTDQEPSEPDIPGPEAVPLPADWLDDAVQTDDAPLPPDWLDEAEATSPDKPDRAEGRGEPFPMSSSEQASAADASAEPATLPSLEEDAAWLFNLDEEEKSSAEPSAAEPSPTGFTGLLAEIQTQRAIQDVSEMEARDVASEPEPVPPDWLTDFGEADAAETTDSASVLPMTTEEASSEVEAGTVGELFDLFEEADGGDAALAEETEATLSETSSAEEASSEVEAGTAGELFDLFEEADGGDAALAEETEAALSETSSAEEVSSEVEAGTVGELFDLFEEADGGDAALAEETEATLSEASSAEQPTTESAAPLDAPEWLVEPEYDFFAPEASLGEESPPLGFSDAEVSSDGAVDDWLDTLEEADEEGLTDVFSAVADEGKSAEEPSSELDWLSESSDAPADEDMVEALFAAVEESSAAELSPAQSAVEQEDDWLAGLPTDEDAVLSVVDAEDSAPTEVSDDAGELAFSAGEDAVESVLNTLEAGVPTLEESADEPLAFDTVEESLLGDEEETAMPRTSSLEERVAQFVQNDDSPAWLAGVETELPSDAIASFSGEEQAVEYRAAGQTGVLQPDEAPAWMAAFTGDDVPEEVETEATAEDPFGAPEAVVTSPEVPIEADPDASGELTTRILQPETPAASEASEARVEEPGVSVTEDVLLDTDELFADVLGEMSEAAEETESAEEGELPAWLQAITQSEADKLDETLFEDVEAYSSSAEDSGILQPGQEDEWLQVLEGETAADDVSAEPASAAEPTALEDAEAVLGFLQQDEDAPVEAVALEEEGTSETEEALLDFLDLDAAAIAEMDFEDIASELEEAALQDVSDDFAASQQGFDAALAASEKSVLDAVAEASDLSHTMDDDAHTAALHDEDEAPEDDFSFDGMVPRWLRRPQERISGEAQHNAPEDDASAKLPEWLRDASEDLDRPDRND